MAGLASLASNCRLASRAWPAGLAALAALAGCASLALGDAWPIPEGVRCARPRSGGLPRPGRPAPRFARGVACVASLAPGGSWSSQIGLAALALDLAACPGFLGDLGVDGGLGRLRLLAAADLALLLGHEEDLVLLEQPVVGAPLAAVVE